MPICFYPDWIIKTNLRTSDNREIYLIVDTKAGMTLDDSGSTGAKIKALFEWCNIQNTTNEQRMFLCGIVTFEGGFWKISANNIDYFVDSDYSNFVILEDWLNNVGL